MIPWITSRSFIIDLNPHWTRTHGEAEWSMGRIGVDVGSLHQRLDKLIEELNSDQWEIKLIQPLQRGVTYQEHQRVIQAASRKAPETAIGGFGFGWGTEATSGFVVIAQQTLYLTPDEYVARRDEQKLKTFNTVANLFAVSNHSEMGQLQAELDKLRNGDSISARKTGLLRSEKYHFQGKDYTSYAEADAARGKKVIELEKKISSLT